jgi:nucleotide-binding universal stress UspA family protein
MNQTTAFDIGRRCVVAAVHRIVVGVHGSLGSLQALRYAADEAQAREVPLVPVIAWVPPGGDLAERGHPSPYMRQVWREAARQRLAAAFDEGLGGVPSGMVVEPLVERGETGPVLVDVASEPGDLLVVGTGRRSLIRRALCRPVGRYLLVHAYCPVIAVPPSPLMDELGHGPWPLRRRTSRLLHEAC